MAATTADSEEIWFKFYPSNRDWETVPVMSEIKNIKELKQAIKEYDDNREVGKKKMLYGVDLDEVTLNASQQDDYSESISVPGPLNLETVLKRLGVTIIGNDICKQFAEKVWIFVNLPQQVQKRSQDEEAAESSSKRVKLEENNSILNAIELAGLTEKAVVDGRHNLSLLTGTELVSVLDKTGTGVSAISDYTTLSQTAASLRNSSFQNTDLISSPLKTRLPVINMRDLYVRQAYLDLYDEIDTKFNNTLNDNALKHVAVTGTAGIGKSAFLVYFIIRILATSSDDNPPIIIFQEKEGTDCYAFGGLSTVRYGDLKDFRPFLELPKIWYLVDSSPNPLLPRAKTIISASPLTLYSEVRQYQEIAKRIPWTYYMAPWKLPELEECRSRIEDFRVIPKDFFEELYMLIGGVPRYVLEKPKGVLSLTPDNLVGARRVAYERVQHALDNIQDPLKLMQYFEQGKDSLIFSSRLLHRLPIGDHSEYRLDWGSVHIREEVFKVANDTTWQLILERLVNGTVGEAKGTMFEFYVRHVIRRGKCTFRFKDLQDNSETPFDIPPNPPVKFFDTINDVTPGTLYFPRITNFACVDALLAPNCLFQITVSERHPIKGEPFKKLLGSLVENHWIETSKDAQLIFVVPQDIYGDFKKQSYLKGKVVDTDVPEVLKDVKQYVLGVDLRAASTGGSPGMTREAIEALRSSTAPESL